MWRSARRRTVLTAGPPCCACAMSRGIWWGCNVVPHAPASPTRQMVQGVFYSKGPCVLRIYCKTADVCRLFPVVSTASRCQLRREAHHAGKSCADRPNRQRPQVVHIATARQRLKDAALWDSCMFRTCSLLLFYSRQFPRHVLS